MKVINLKQHMLVNISWRRLYYATYTTRNIFAVHQIVFPWRFLLEIYALISVANKRRNLSQIFCIRRF